MIAAELTHGSEKTATTNNLVVISPYLRGDSKRLNWPAEELRKCFVER